MPVDCRRAERVKDDKVRMQREAKKIGKTGRRRKTDVRVCGEKKANDRERKREKAERLRCNRTRGDFRE